MNNIVTLETPEHNGLDQYGWLQRRQAKKFTGFDDMVPYLEERSNKASTMLVKNKDIRLAVIEEPKSRDEINQLGLIVEDRVIGFNHWSFGQLSSLAKSPAGYLRSLPSLLVRDCLEYSLSYVREVEDVKLYTDATQLRAVTGPGYGRVADSEVARAVQTIVGDSDRWEPAANHMGFSATDRSMNLFIIDKANPVVVGTTARGTDDIMYRGFRASNSEVGAGSLTVEGFFFRAYCENGLIFGMNDAESINIRHSKNAPYRWAREVQPAIMTYANQDGMKLVEAVKSVKETRVAYDDDQMLRWLGKRGLSRSQSKIVMERIETEENTSGRTAWDAVQGITSLARTCEHVEDRVLLERVAGKIWSKAA